MQYFINIFFNYKLFLNKLIFFGDWGLGIGDFVFGFVELSI